jgi:branched-chain amino acid aminotransferase
VPGKVWIGGAVVDAAEARVPVFDRGFLYGDSVYEVTRTFGGRPFALDEHLDRLARSGAGLGMALPPRDEIARAVEEAVAQSGEAECYVRVVVTRGSGPIGLDPALADAPRLVVLALPLSLPDAALYRDGATVAIVGARRSAPGSVDPQVKSGNYLSSVMAVAEARRRGAYEALMCDSVGRLAEGASSNLFLVRPGANGARLATPPLSVGLLEGITRRHVIDLARSAGLGVDELALWPADLQRAEEAFLTSSVRGVMPIVRVDGPDGSALIGDGRPGPVTRRIAAAYLAAAAR